MGKCAFTQIELASQAKCYVSPTNGLFKQSSTKTNIGKSRVSEFWSNMGCDPLKFSSQDCTGWEDAADLRSTWKWYGKDPEKSSLSWSFQVVASKFSLESELLHHWILLFARIYLSIAKGVSAAQQAEGMCYHTCWKALGRVFSPLVTPVQLWEETCPAGTSGSCPSLLLWCWGPCASRAGPWHGAASSPGLCLGETAAPCGTCRWAPGCCGSTEGFGEEQHKCSHLNCVSRNWFCCTEFNSHLISIKVKRKTHK